MAKYMLLIYGDPAAGPAQGTPAAEERFNAWMQISQELGESGAMIAGDALQPVQTATTVRVRGGDDVVTDGPFAETKEQLAGYYLVDVEDLDAAVAWARRMPNVGEGSVEVRPVMEFDGA